MEKKKVMLADGSEAFCADFELTLREYSEFEFVGAFTDGKTVVRAVKDRVPDILVLDLMLPGKDGITVLKELSTMQKRPVVIAMTRFITDYVASETAKLGAKYLFAKPADVDEIIGHMQQIQGAEVANNAMDGMDMERELAKKLHSLGVPADIRGYYYLMEAIKITVSDRTAVFDMTKKIYEPVAAQFNVTAKHVSKAMAHAVEVAWDRGDLDTLQRYFGYTVSNTRGMPTNSECIAIVAERIRLDMND